jgi:hypothetical protein
MMTHTAVNKQIKFSDYAILALSFGLAPHGGIHMQFVKGKPPETQCATCPGARAKRREVALGRPGFEAGRIRAWLSLDGVRHGNTAHMNETEEIHQVW